MSYQQTEKPRGFLYHYTTRDHLEDILRDGRIRRMGDKECWFCTSLEDTLELMQKTVMMEGKPYYGVGGVLRYYPVFVPESYVILRMGSVESGASTRSTYFFAGGGKAV